MFNNFHSFWLLLLKYFNAFFPFPWHSQRKGHVYWWRAEFWLNKMLAFDLRKQCLISSKLYKIVPYIYLSQTTRLTVDNSSIDCVVSNSKLACLCMDLPAGLKPFFIFGENWSVCNNRGFGNYLTVETVKIEKIFGFIES